MPTESRKKKSTNVEKKSLLSIKKEADDVKPLEHYVDDRIELIKQIFGTLKSKTIESIIPEFLQDKPVDEIQEICLEEVLGISKKRLLSIINATKCPSDTESSDSGSDVEKIEEHISLEEISSDSNDELSKPKKKKKRDSNNKKVVPKPAVVPKLEKKSAEQAEQNGQGSGKKYSVLELLELQARARAIRSQLALEPVTKIELDDSDTEPTSCVPDNKEKEKESEDDKTSSVAASNSRHNEKDVSKPTEGEEPKLPPTRPVRLKRNFRQRQMEGYESDESQSVTVPEQENTNVAKRQTPEKSPVKGKIPEKAVEPAAPNDDDVVPIISEPEILCISSSDSENEEKKEKKENNKPKRSYITMPIIEKVVRPPTEDELFLQKIIEKSDAKKGGKIVASKSKPVAIDANNDEQNKIGKTKDTQSKDIEQSAEEMEDGEIIEDEDDEVLEIPESPEAPASKVEPDENEDGKADRIEKLAESRNDSVQVTDKSRNDSSSSGSESDDGANSDSSSNKSDNSEPKPRSQTSKKSTADDDDDDDIIDLGKDEDLDFEQLEIDTTPVKPEEKTSTRRTRSKSKKSDRDSSTEHEPKDESWDKRWLRGDKVSKVLATAKLANKIRSKIKERMTKTAVIQHVEEPEPVKEITPQIPLNVEVGSVEHYKELTKQK